MSATHSIGAKRSTSTRVVIKGGGDAITAARSVLKADEADYAWNLQVDPDTLVEMEAAGQGSVVSAFFQPRGAHRDQPYQPGPRTGATTAPNIWTAQIHTRS